MRKGNIEEEGNLQVCEVVFVVGTVYIGGGIEYFELRNIKLIFLFC